MIMRMIFLLLPLALLGCNALEDSPEFIALQEGCAGGDMSACAMVAHLKQERRAAIGAAVSGMGDSITEASAVRPVSTTRCTPGYGNSINCTTY